MTTDTATPRRGDIAIPARSPTHARTGSVSVARRGQAIHWRPCESRMSKHDKPSRRQRIKADFWRPEERRVWVRKRFVWGWTINWAALLRRR